MLPRSGEITAPWPVPLSATVTTPSSRMPALSHLRIHRNFNSTALAAQLAGNRLHQTHGPADRATTKQDECGADGEDGQNRLAMGWEGTEKGTQYRIPSHAQ